MLVSRTWTGSKQWKNSTSWIV